MACGYCETSRTARCQMRESTYRAHCRKPISNIFDLVEPKMWRHCEKVPRSQDGALSIGFDPFRFAYSKPFFRDVHSQTTTTTCLRRLKALEWREGVDASRNADVQREMAALRAIKRVGTGGEFIANTRAFGGSGLFNVKVEGDQKPGLSLLAIGNLEQIKQQRAEEMAGALV